MASGFESQASLVCIVSFFSLLFLKGKTRFLSTLCTFEKMMMGLNPIVHPYEFTNFLFQMKMPPISSPSCTRLNVSGDVTG